MGYARFWPFAAAAFALVLLSGALGVLLGLIVTLGIYGVVVWRYQRTRSMWAYACTSITLVTACSLLMAAAQLLPAWTYLQWVSPDALVSPLESAAPLLADSAARVAWVLAAPMLLVWGAIRSLTPDSYRRRVDTLLITASVVWVLTLIPEYLSFGLMNGAGLPASFLLLFGFGIVTDAWTQIVDSEHRSEAIRRARLPWIGGVLIVLATGYGLRVAGSPGALEIAGIAVVAFTMLLIATTRFHTPCLLGWGVGLVITLYIALAWPPGERWRGADEEPQ